MRDGSLYVGVITKDQDGAVTIVDVNGTATDLPWTRIKSRQPNSTSAMPPMGGPLARKQVRDGVEFLASQKG